MFSMLCYTKLLHLCPTLCNATYCSLPGSSVHGFSQVRILEWVAISFSRRFPNPGIELVSPALTGGLFTKVYQVLTAI